MPGILILVVVVAVLVWLIAPSARRQAAPDDDPVEPVDQEELEAAEQEVRDLDLHQRPEEGFEGDDWGPGTTKRKT
jgi:hypothetical protein